MTCRCGGGRGVNDMLMCGGVRGCVCACVFVCTHNPNNPQPMLKHKTREVQSALTSLQRDQKEAASMTAACAADADAAAAQRMVCVELKATCKAELDTALPGVGGAVEALKSLSKGGGGGRVWVDVCVCVYVCVCVCACTRALVYSSSNHLQQATSTT